MTRLRVVRMGSDAEGIQLRGNPAQPEPVHTRIEFPGGDVDVVRTDDGSYWVHVRIDSPEDVAQEAATVAGKLVDARLDCQDRATGEADTGDFANPTLYHLAVRVARA